MDAAENSYIKGTVEAILFVCEKPVTVDQIKEVIEGVDGASIRETITALQRDYEARQSGIVIVEIAGGFQMLTSSQYALAIRKFFKTRHKEKLSRPALETLAIIAYKQPVSRLDIELIRGVNSDGVTDHLLAKGLVKIVGRKDVPGRPYLYGTTKQFLEYFGLKSLSDLPKIEDFTSLQEAQDAEDQSLAESNKKTITLEEASEEVVMATNEDNYARRSEPSTVEDPTVAEDNAVGTGSSSSESPAPSQEAAAESSDKG